MSRIYTTVTCLPEMDELDVYLSRYLPVYCGVQRRIFQDLKNGEVARHKRSEYVSSIQKRFGVLKRTVNSAIFDMQGRIHAYHEMKKTELEETRIKLTEVEKKIGPAEKLVAEMKPHAASNSLTEKELEKYREAKRTLYCLQDKKNRLKQKADALEKKIASGDVSLCFGTRDFFSKQYRLEENGLHSHEGWYNAYVKKRDSGIFYLGSGEEKYGNQIIQLQYTGKDFTVILRKDKPFRAEKTRCLDNIQIVINHVSFGHMQSELQAAIEAGQPITYRISKKKKRWYLAASFEMEVPLQTFRANGVFGIDYNDGFLEVVETNDSGNMVSAEHIPLEHHGIGGKAETEIKEKLSKLVRHAKDEGKDIVAEDLNFIKKKAKTMPARSKRGKAYNRMLHLFDYNRYLTWLENLCDKYGVGFNKVNPAFTSKKGNRKYAKPRKMTIHRAAAFVVARRGQGFKD